jgi:CheY-like chemotaxis protein
MGDPSPEGVVEASPTTAQSVQERTTLLVVEDSAFFRHQVGRLLEAVKDIRLVYASNGKEGLEVIERECPAVILTDLIMPEMEGLELVQHVRARFPHISVILMTAFGSEEVAMRALRAGAANYIPKKRLAYDLVPTIRQILAVATTTRERRRILACMERRETTFMLDNDPDLILALLKLLREEIEGLNIADQCGQLQLGVALHEALCNAHFHGNLEVSSELRQEDERVFESLAEERRGQAPYSSRRIRVQVRLDREAARFVVADEGPGFDTKIFARPVEPEDLHRIGGRGLLLIRTFMDEVSFNESGNQITMVKFRNGLNEARDPCA